MPNPMERLNAYSTPDGQGGVRVDLEGLAVDLVTVAKAAGYDRVSFLACVAQTYDDVHVEVTRPPNDGTHRAAAPYGKWRH